MCWGRGPGRQLPPHPPARPSQAARLCSIAPARGAPWSQGRRGASMRLFCWRVRRMRTAVHCIVIVGTRRATGQEPGEVTRQMVSPASLHCSSARPPLPPPLRSSINPHAPTHLEQADLTHTLEDVRAHRGGRHLGVQVAEWRGRGDWQVLFACSYVCLRHLSCTGKVAQHNSVARGEV